MAPTRKPVDTTDDPELEARWQALVHAVVDAKQRAADAKATWAQACSDRGSLITATPEAIAAADAAKADYDQAIEDVKAAGERMKAGDL